MEHDQELGRIPLLGGIGDEETVRAAHLIGGQPQAGRRVHRLHHVVDQLLEVAIEIGDTSRRLPQDRRAVGENPSRPHGVLRRAAGWRWR
jgi:hypothetical protein